MKDATRTSLSYVKNFWLSVWFQKKNTIPLEIVRIGIGFLMFYNYILLAPEDIISLYGDSGLFSHAVSARPHLSQFSFFVYFTHSWQLLVFHYVFVSMCFCLFIGWNTRWLKWAVLIGHISYTNQNEYTAYGVDYVLTALLFILCIAPIGKALSVDRMQMIKKLKSTPETLAESYKSEWGFACQRMMQLQMAVIFFSAGYEKLQGQLWISGNAPWIAFNNNVVAFFPMGFFADHYWIISLIAYTTIFIEVAYIFLIWSHRTRPYILFSAILLHVGIAVMMGMYYFASVMICGHLVFMRRHWYINIGGWLKTRLPGRWVQTRSISRNV